MIEDLRGMVPILPVWVKLAHELGFGVQVGNLWYFRPEEEAKVRAESAQRVAEKAEKRRAARREKHIALRAKKERETAAAKAALPPELRLAVAAARRLMSSKSYFRPIDAAEEVAGKYGVKVSDVARLLREKVQSRSRGLHSGRSDR